MTHTKRRVTWRLTCTHDGFTTHGGKRHTASQMEEHIRAEHSRDGVYTDKTLKVTIQMDQP